MPTTADRNRRSTIVWLSFVVVMTFVATVLAISARSNPRSGYLAASLADLTDSPGPDPIFNIEAPLDTQRWQGIVIHDLGAPIADAESIHRMHVKSGYEGLGYHFVIGNGKGDGLGDGVVHIGYRWNEQLPGVHVAGEAGRAHNLRSIGICLVGNGDRRPPTAEQVANLTALVHRLQRALNIPAERVYRHSELFAGTTSPGRYFPAAAFDAQLLR